MNKICCVGDASVCPKSSSCSMVLRSACSHGHSRESSAVKKHSDISSSRKSKHVSKKKSHNGALSLESALESSFKQLALKSAEKTYALLKERFYNRLEFSESVDQKIYEASSINVSCAKELEFSPLSLSDSSYVFNNISRKECSSDYSSANESDINSSESLVSTSKMSTSTPTRRFTRSSLSSARTLSGSEGEDDIMLQKIVRPGRNISESGNTISYNSTRKSVFSERAINGQYLSSNHDSHFESRHNTNNNFKRYTEISSDESGLTNLIDPLQLGRSSIQYSLFDRFRWFLWRWAYLKIIKIISFDVWLLSRLRDYGKYKVIFYLLLPLLLFLVWGIFQHNPVSYSDLSQAIYSAISFVLTFWSSLFSSLFGYFVQEEEVVTEIEDCGESCNLDSSKVLSIFSGLAGLFGPISGWFARNDDSTVMESKYESGGYVYQKTDDEIKSFHLSKEEIRLMASQIFKEEINTLKEFIKNSVHATEAENLKKELKLQNEIKNLRLEFQSLSGIMGRLENDFKKQKENIDPLKIKLTTLEAQLGVLEQLKSCCDKQFRLEDFMAILDKHLLSAFRSVVDGDADPSSKYYFFNQWLNSKFFSHEKLMHEINAALKKQSAHSEKSVNYDNVIKVVESTVVKHVDSIKRNLTDMNMFSYSSFTDDYFSEDKIKKIVKEAIMLYDADKTGQVDYALESGGGSVLGTRCSETYVEKYGKISFFGVPIWTSSNSPRTAIQPDVQPGRCWAFKGSQGFLVLELSATIYPTGFTLEHIPVSLSPTGLIDSAPKRFSVWGLESEKDNKGLLLGEYLYDINGEPLQYFDVQKPSGQPYNFIELQIHSNHGNMEYTCLYRFRVHGKRAP